MNEIARIKTGTWLLSSLVFLALLVPASAAAQISAIQPAPKWWGQSAGSGFRSCQDAYNAAFDATRILQNDPLVVGGATCETAVQVLGTMTAFHGYFRRTTEPVDAISKEVFIRAECPAGSGPVDHATHGVICTVPVAPDPSRNTGDCLPCLANPVYPAYGNKMQREADYVGFGPFPLRFERVYNSARGQNLDIHRSALTSNWTHNYARRLSHTQEAAGSIFAVSINRPDGKVFSFNLSGANYITNPEVNARLVRLAGGWQLTTEEDEVELYDGEGRLTSISNRAGLSKTFSY